MVRNNSWMFGMIAVGSPMAVAIAHSEVGLLVIGIAYAVGGLHWWLVRITRACEQLDKAVGNARIRHVKNARARLRLHRELRELMTWDRPA
jgi:hypothetical protein